MEILKLKPCGEGLEYRRKFNTFEEAWNVCNRPDWMIWVAYKLGVDIKTIIKVKAECASLVLCEDGDVEDITAKTVAAAFKFANGTISMEELNKCNTDIYVHLRTLNYTPAYRKGYAAFGCTMATYSMPHYADLKQSADICRKLLTEPVLAKIKEL